MKQKRTELKGEKDIPTTRAGDFNTLLSTMYRKTRQKISKEIEYLNTAINQLDITDMYKHHIQ